MSELYPAPAPDGDDEPELDDVEVDVDLDSMDDALRREAVGKSMTVKVDGKVIHVTHAGDWSSSAMRAAGNGDWDTWAREVVMDQEEYRTWVEADLRNYQIEAVFQECGRQSRMNLGKSQRRAGSRHNTRRR
jgi:hypothetical protein